MTISHYKIPKDLMIAISDLRLNGTQWSILWKVFINNYDNGAREMPLSILEQVTGYCRKQISRELNKLIKMKILTETCKPDYINARVLNINTNICEWRKTHESYTNGGQGNHQNARD
jgi:hypothetical protein